MVFALDFLKGFLPTLIFPWLARRWPGGLPADLAVQVALATILGHNFPVYLKFRGGKGVATSLGALSALEPVASGVSVIVFAFFVILTRYVSLSSILGGFGFATAYFVRQADPWRRDHVALTLLTIGLLILILVRHRKNISRLIQGTEPQVGRSRKSPPDASAPRSGFARQWILALIVPSGIALLLTVRSIRPPSLDCGEFVLETLQRVETGEQRADRICFANKGRLIAVACPRYGRVVLLNLDDRDRPKPIRSVELEGRPVALAAFADRIFVLQRPSGDARHVEEAWLETIDLAGNLVDPRVRVGFDPDDIAVAPDGKTVYVLTSGRAEGETNRPLPALCAYDLDAGRKPARPIARLEFRGSRDDPARLTLSDQGRVAIVTLLGSNRLAAIDLSDRERPRLLERRPLPTAGVPYVSRFENDAIAMPVDLERQTVRLETGSTASGEGFGRVGWLLSISPDRSELEIIDEAERKRLGGLELRGASNLGSMRPAAIAYSPERRLIAVADRQGGGINLIALRPKVPQGLDRRP